jgi:hypothetical protein
MINNTSTDEAHYFIPYRSLLILLYLACPADVVVGTTSFPEDADICYTVGSEPALYLYVIQCTV